jgi:Na+/H+ antiporter NhaA
LAAAAGLILAVAVMRWSGVRSLADCGVAGVGLWRAFHESGVHATLTASHSGS